MTTPVVLPDEYRDNTDYIEIKIDGTLKVSNIISIIFSLFNIGFKGTINIYEFYFHIIIYENIYFDL